MASVYKRGNVWWVKVSVGGKAISKSAGRGASKREAQALAADLEAKAFKGVPEVGRRVRIGELLDLVLADYELHGRRTISDARARIERHLRPALGHLPVTVSDFGMYLRARLDAGARPGTVNRETALLSKAFGLGVARRLVAHKPVLQYLDERDGIRQGCTGPEELERLVAACPDEGLALFVRWLGTSGMRVGEARSLTWAMVHGDELRVPGAHVKNKGDRVLPLAGPLADIMAHARSRRRLDCPNVFHRDGRPIGGFRKSWRTVTRAAGLEGLLVHDLRRGAITTLFRAGVPQHLVLRISGHKTTATLLRYNVVQTADTAAALEQLGDYLSRRKRPA